MSVRRLSACALAILFLSAVAIGDDKVAKKGLEGTWQGTIKVGAIELRVVFRIPGKKDAKAAGYLDSPDQGAKDIPIDTAELKDGKVKLEVKKVGGTFTGKMNKDA